MRGLFHKLFNKDFLSSFGDPDWSGGLESLSEFRFKNKLLRLKKTAAITVQTDLCNAQWELHKVFEQSIENAWMW